MVLQTKCTARRISVGACALILTLLLAACGSGSTNSGTGNKSSQPPNGSKSSYTLTATPTTHSSTPATTEPMKVYTGSGFTIEYPQSWKETESGSEIAFTDPSGSYNLTIGASDNADGKVTADQLVDGGLTGAKSNLKNVETISVPQTVTLANQTWSQRSLTGLNTYQGQSTPVQADVLATNYPTHTTATKGFIIAYVALKDKFDQAKTLYFTPMLQSFKFTA